MSLLTPFRFLAQVQFLVLCVGPVFGLRTEIVGRPSVVIAGIGDSGTTAVTKALEKVGMDHCHNRDVYEEPPWGHTGRENFVKSLLNVSKGDFTHSAFERNPHMFASAQEWLRKVAHKDHRCILQQRLNASQSIGKETQDRKWGFKEPHYAWLLPAMDAAFKNKTRYLLVARDPRDVCTNNIQDQFNLYSKFLNISDCYQWWATFWTKLLDAYEREPRFAIVRIEDLVVPDPKVSQDSLRTLGCMADHVGMKADWALLHKAVGAIRVDEETHSVHKLFSLEGTGPALSLGSVREASLTDDEAVDPQYASVFKAVAEVKHFHGHNNSYMGHHKHFNDSSRFSLVKKTKQSQTLVRFTMLRLGYDPDAFRLMRPTSRACLCRRP